MTGEANYIVTLKIIRLLQGFLDRARNYEYIPGDLRLVINITREKIHWAILKNPYLAILTPHKMFLGTIKAINDEKLYVTDQKLTIDGLIEGVYSTRLDEPSERILLKHWNSPQKLIQLQDTHPKLYEIIKKRNDIIKDISRKHYVKINNKLEKETKHVWIEVERDLNNLDMKELIKQIFESIEILREIYKNIFECNDEDQEYKDASKESLINQLKIHISAVYETALKFKEKIFWRHVGISEWLGATGSYIKLILKTKNGTQIDIHTSRELEEQKPNKYTIIISLRGPQHTISKIKNIPEIEVMDNQLYYEKRDLTLPQTLEEIKNIIQAATE